MENMLLHIGLGAIPAPTQIPAEKLSAIATALARCLREELDIQLAAIEQEYVDWEALQRALADPEQGLEVMNFLREATQSRRELLAKTPGFQRMLDQRAHAGRLAFRLGVLPGAELQLTLAAAPWDACAGAFADDIVGFEIWLQQHLADVLEAEGIIGAKTVELLNKERVRDYFHAEPMAAGTPHTRGKDEKENRLFWWLSIGAMLIPVAIAGLMMWKVYGWVEDTNASYKDLKNTIFVQKEQIVKRIEQTITTSDKVMNIVESVEGLLGGKSE